MRSSATQPGTQMTLLASLITVLACSLSVLPISAQSLSTGQPTFEVASVKRVDNAKLGDTISMNIGTIRGEQITFSNATLHDCLRFAYGATSDAQIVGPDWLTNKSFLYDITAKAAPGATQEQFQAMLQALLAERFKLVVHSAPREMSYFALTVSKRGSQMRGVAAVPESSHRKTWGGSIDSVMTMPILAYLLSRFDTERPTIDKTGLTGLFEVKLSWTPANKVQSAEGDTGVSLFTAVQEQLGLRLDERKGPVNVWVIDAAEKSPTEN